MVGVVLFNGRIRCVLAREKPDAGDLADARPWWWGAAPGEFVGEWASSAKRDDGGRTAAAC